MNIQSVDGKMPTVSGGVKQQGVKSFQNILKQAFKSTNEYQKQYDEMIEKQLTDEVSLSDVIIAGEKARLSLELTLQLRNKAIEAYQEIMRMQI